jgi:hypothetical protein
LNTLFGIGEQNDDKFKSRQVQRYLRAMINVEPSTSSGDGMTFVGASTSATAAGLPQEPQASIITPDGSALNASDNLEINRRLSPTNRVYRNPDPAKELEGRPRPRIICRRRHIAKRLQTSRSSCFVRYATDVTAL